MKTKQIIVPKAKNTTHIKIIDDYYKTINQQDEVEMFILRNESKRLEDQVKVLWSSLGNMSKSEIKFVQLFT